VVADGWNYPLPTIHYPLSTIHWFFRPLCN
jgi:hypothetical protein